MSKPVKNALRALARIKEERAAAAQREAEAKLDAAREYGQLVLDCGGDQLDPADVETIIRKAVQLGADEVIRRLKAPNAEPRASSPVKAEEDRREAA